jgi:hypothetical protein
MLMRAHAVAGALAAVALVGGPAGPGAAQAGAAQAGAAQAGAAQTGAAQTGAAQEGAHAPGQLAFELQPAALRFFSNTGPIHGWPTKPLVPGDRVIGQDRVLEGGAVAGYDNEVCTVSFAREVLCQDIVVVKGRGDVQASWSVRWPATGNRGPVNFDGIIDGGTAAFRDAHGAFHAHRLPNGDLQITATVGGAR